MLQILIQEENGCLSSAEASSALKLAIKKRRKNMSMYYEITGFVTYDNPEFEVESVVERLEQEGIAVDIFPGTLGSSRIEFSFFNDAHYGFEEEILRILTKNNLEMLSGEVSVDTSEEGTLKYELLHGEIRKKTEKNGHQVICRLRVNVERTQNANRRIM